MGSPVRQLNREERDDTSDGKVDFVVYAIAP